MSGYWEEATKNERDVRNAAHSEAVHDMRVAVRRLRVAFALFTSWYDKRDIRGFEGELRRLGRRLGSVRDGEVLLQNARAAAQELPQADLSGLLTRWEADHAAAKVRLLDYLDCPSFGRFRNRFESFLERDRSAETPAEREPDDDAPEIGARLVCDVMPAEIWNRYGAVHAYAPIAADASVEQLHRLRIAGKHLRYAVESFRELVGVAGKNAVGALRDLQDALGLVHDAHVAIDLLERYRARHTGPNDIIEPYIERQREALAGARAQFESLWPEFTGVRLRQHISDCAAALAGVPERSAGKNTESGVS
jgi:CHAD domain-containing protein